MVTFNSRLFNAPKLRRIIEVADDISNLCNELADPLADYEAVDELPSSEQPDAREEARERAWQIMGEAISQFELFRAMRDSLYDDTPGDEVADYRRMVGVLLPRLRPIDVDALFDHPADRAAAIAILAESGPVTTQAVVEES